jgi:hypothetical protein
MTKRCLERSRTEGDTGLIEIGVRSRRPWGTPNGRGNGGKKEKRKEERTLELKNNEPLTKEKGKRRRNALKGPDLDILIPRPFLPVPSQPVSTSMLCANQQVDSRAVKQSVQAKDRSNKG